MDCEALFQILFVYIQIIAFVFGRHTRSSIHRPTRTIHVQALCVGFPRGNHFTGIQIVAECFTCVKRRTNWRNHLFCYICSLCAFVCVGVFVGFCVYETHNGEVIDVGEMDIATKRGLREQVVYTATSVNCLWNTQKYLCYTFFGI